MLWIVIGLALVVLVVVEVRSWKTPEKLGSQYGHVLESRFADDSGKSFDAGAALRKPRD